MTMIEHSNSVHSLPNNEYNYVTYFQDKMYIFAIMMVIINSLICHSLVCYAEKSVITWQQIN